MLQNVLRMFFLAVSIRTLTSKKVSWRRGFVTKRKRLLNHYKTPTEKTSVNFKRFEIASSKKIKNSISDNHQSAIAI